MAGLDIAEYLKSADLVDREVSMENLHAPYEDADKALARLALGLDDNVSDMPDLESTLLDHQAFLIDLAAKTQCRTTKDIYSKIDFLKRVYLDEMHVENYTPTDRLLLSVWQDLDFDVT